MSICYDVGDMARMISVDELVDNCTDILEAVDKGETFVVTNGGVPVANLRPHRQTIFVSAEDVVADFSVDPAIDFQQFRTDVDGGFDIDVNPR
jgi:antitoxin (DNA-binding transcriptional repressor) of toxin-antitoxin stability system